MLVSLIDIIIYLVIVTTIVMAESGKWPGRSSASIIRKVHDELVCAVCLDILKSPKLLACAHSFCRNCLSDVVAATRNGAPDVVVCPCCRAEMPLEGKNVDLLPNNPHLLNLVDIISPEIQQRSRNAFRERLRRASERMKPTTSVDLAKTVLCDQHSKRPLEFYCTNCHELCCSTCLVAKHRAHDFHEADTFLWDQLSSLPNMIQPAIEATVRAEELITRASNTHKETITNHVAISQSIKTHFDSMRKLLDERERQLQRMAEEYTTKTIEGLGSLETQLPSKQTAIGEAITVIDRLLDQEHVGDFSILPQVQEVTEVLSRCQHAIQELAGEVGKHASRRLVLNPSEAELVTSVLGYLEECTPSGNTRVSTPSSSPPPPPTRPLSNPLPPPHLLPLSNSLPQLHPLASPLRSPLASPLRSPLAQLLSSPLQFPLSTAMPTGAMPTSVSLIRASPTSSTSIASGDSSSTSIASGDSSRSGSELGSHEMQAEKIDILGDDDATPPASDVSSTYSVDSRRNTLPAQYQQPDSPSRIGPLLRSETDPVFSPEILASLQGYQTVPHMRRSRTGSLHPRQQPVYVFHTRDGTSDVYPCGIALGQSDSIVVSDMHGNCIKLFARSGRSVGTISNDRRDSFKGPSSVTMDVEGRIYIVESETNQLQRYSSGQLDRAFAQNVRKFPSNYGDMRAIAVDRLHNRTIYVTDGKKRCVHTFERSGKYHYTLTVGYLKEPTGVAITAGGNLVVADSESHCVWIMKTDGRQVSKIGKQGKLPGEFQQPYGVAIMSDDSIVVSDSELCRISVFDPNGTFKACFGGKGAEVGQFNQPRHVCVNSKGQIVVADELNKRVQIFDA